jgi:F1F0 ATPase subunit 2
MNTISPSEIFLYLAAGAALGALYFLLLLLTVRLHAAQAAAIRVAPLYLLRFAAAALTFWFFARQGASPLLLALLGFLIARTATLRWKGSV